MMKFVRRARSAATNFAPSFAARRRIWAKRPRNTRRNGAQRKSTWYLFRGRAGALYFLYFLSPFSCLFVCVYVRVCLYCKGQIPSVHAPRLAAETCYPPHAFKTCGAVNARVHECLPDWVHPGVLSPILLRRPANGSSIAMVRKHKKKHKGDTGGGALDG